ncbi:hypothetical protein JSO19_03815 [Leucobacter sp. UCMA 4100]|uniref:hypothetical protein n=1 Tax=Leucobacter sp. UCMA 4100 TaxID=2810534 RepID=UPI0022EB1DFD|nr:hypothetical protein [Leucobacter sp. UCMA 4100]MDA3146502.1 hypothetical protein [Leucobacter sp. UCMA 4100]
MNTEIVEQTKEQLTKESRTKSILFIIGGALIALVIAVIAVVVFMRALPGGDIEATPETVKPHIVSDTNWSIDATPGARHVVTPDALVVLTDDTVTLLSSSDATHVATLEDARGASAATAFDGGVIVFNDDAIWTWIREATEFTKRDIPTGTHVRVLGDTAFTISDDRTKINVVEHDATLTEVTPPKEGAVPLTSVGDTIMWVTAGDNSIITQRGSETVSETKLVAPADATGVLRRLAATDAFAYVVWEAGEVELLAIHDVMTGALHAVTEVVDAAEQTWRLSTDRSLAYFASVLIDTNKGEMSLLTSEIADPVALQKSFSGHTTETEILTFSPSGASVLSGDVTQVLGQFANGLYLIEKGSQLHALETLPYRDLS